MHVNLRGHFRTATYCLRLLAKAQKERGGHLLFFESHLIYSPAPIALSLSLSLSLSLLRLLLHICSLVYMVILVAPPPLTPSPHFRINRVFIDNQTYLLSSTFQLTVSSRNPSGNRRSLLYEGLRVHVSYHDQQVTLATRLPPTYEGRGGVDVWSPFVYGASVPIAPYNALALNQDQSDGFVKMKVKLQGHVRWRPGIFTSGGFISVDCPAYITTGSKNIGVPLGFSAVKYQLMQRCGVSL
ncbi:uncharacterized protein J3R85_020161 [Psidium guajava]|nr:uncharacterized protein J3R85_020161 [Psidium guajava]